MADLVTYRRATRADAVPVRAILLAAFEGPAEADLVDALEADGDLAVHLVAVLDGRVVGTVVLSRMTGMAALALAPLAVAADHRRRGIGAGLVREAMAAAVAEGADAVFVLGDPAYYEPLGFSRELARPVRSAFAGPHFMAATPDGMRTLPACEVRYARAFDALG